LSEQEKKPLEQKPYYRIGEVAKHLGVQTHVLRYWEGEFPQVQPTRAPSGHRLYKAHDVELLNQVKELLHDKGFTLAGAKKLLSEQEDSTVQPGLFAPEPTVQVKHHDTHEIIGELREILKILQ
jgi:DNA-binding transcriptional MerR regulator